MCLRYMEYNKTCSFFKFHYFWFELFNQKTFEMKILKMAHVTFLVIFHLKVSVCQKNNYHILMVIGLKETHLWYDNYQTFHMAHILFWSYGITMLVDPTNFINIKSNLNHFLNIFAFWISYDIYIFFAQMYSTSHHMK